MAPANESSSLTGSWETADPGPDVDQLWRNEPREALVSVQQFGPSEHAVFLEQYLSARGWMTRVVTHGASFDSEDVATSRARDLMAEVADGEHLVECLEAVEHDEMVDFVCIYTDDLPPDVEREELADTIRAHIEDGDANTVSELESPDNVTVDIFPRPMTNVRPTENVDVGDPTSVAEASEHHADSS